MPNWVLCHYGASTCEKGSVFDLDLATDVRIEGGSTDIHTEGLIRQSMQGPGRPCEQDYGNGGEDLGIGWFHSGWFCQLNLLSQ